VSDIASKTTISRHILYGSISILMVTLTTILIIITLSFTDYIQRSETIAKQYVSLNERTSKAFSKPVALISEVIYGFAFKSLGEAEIISESEKDSLVASSVKSIKQNSQTLGVLVEAMLVSDDNVLGFGSRAMKAKMSEADAALGSIRTQLRVYYGENGEYPYSRESTYVMGARWNDIQSGELTGKYFSDDDYIYQCYNGDQYTITCLDNNDVLGGDRCLDQSGNLFNQDHIARNMDNKTADVHNIIIKKVIQANSYTYLRASEGGKEYWIATAKQPLEVGMTLHYDQGLEMKDFTSKEIGRTFGSIWYVSNLRSTSSAAAKKVAGDE